MSNINEEEFRLIVSEACDEAFARNMCEAAFDYTPTFVRNAIIYDTIGLLVDKAMKRIKV